MLCHGKLGLGTSEGKKLARNAAVIYLCGLLAETQPILCSLSFNFDVI